MRHVSRGEVLVPQCPQHCGPVCITTRQSLAGVHHGELTMRARRTPGPTGARGSPVTGRHKRPLSRVAPTIPGLRFRNRDAQPSYA
jgi:hypothetical protein